MGGRVGVPADAAKQTKEARREEGEVPTGGAGMSASA
jgi:hypothetical protein